MNEVTRILSGIQHGDGDASAQLLPLVYEELRKLAAQRLGQEKPGQTLQATALVHEAYLRLVDAEQAQRWDSRGHFFVAAAEAMRRILIEKARRKQRVRHGGGRRRVELEDLSLTLNGDEDREELLSLDGALTALEAADLRAAQLVKLRFFAGLTIPQAAEALGISPRTAERDWIYARAWLHRALAAD
jgi:RNA polymerase sigma factor (TIGR02999 family)